MGSGEVRGHAGSGSGAGGERATTVAFSSKLGDKGGMAGVQAAQLVGELEYGARHLLSEGQVVLSGGVEVASDGCEIGVEVAGRRARDW